MIYGNMSTIRYTAIASLQLHKPGNWLTRSSFRPRRPFFAPSCTSTCSLPVLFCLNLCAKSMAWNGVGDANTYLTCQQGVCGQSSLACQCPCANSQLHVVSYMKQLANQPDTPRGQDLNVSLTKILWKRLYETMQGPNLSPHL